jgi:hypothetical protein
MAISTAKRLIKTFNFSLTNGLEGPSQEGASHALLAHLEAFQADLGAAAGKFRPRAAAEATHALSALAVRGGWS